MNKGLSRLRRVAFVATAIASSAALVTSASAAGANFKSASASVNGSGQLVVSFVEVGAGANQALTVRADAQARATYACLNGSGKSATAANKQDAVGVVGTSGSFTADRYGNLSFRYAQMNFGPVMATAAALAIAEVRAITDEPIPHERIGLPGVYVDRIVEVAS